MAVAVNQNPNVSRVEFELCRSASSSKKEMGCREKEQEWLSRSDPDIVIVVGKMPFRSDGTERPERLFD